MIYTSCYVQMYGKWIDIWLGSTKLEMEFVHIEDAKPAHHKPSPFTLNRIKKTRLMKAT